MYFQLIVNPRKAVDHSIDLAVNNPLSQSDEVRGYNVPFVGRKS